MTSVGKSKAGRKEEEADNIGRKGRGGQVVGRRE
jgi:hypothetical protein